MAVAEAGRVSQRPPNVVLGARLSLGGPQGSHKHPHPVEGKWSHTGKCFRGRYGRLPRSLGLLGTLPAKSLCCLSAAHCPLFWNHSFEGLGGPSFLFHLGLPAPPLSPPHQAV